MDGRIYRCAEVFSLFGCGDFWGSWGMVCEGMGAVWLVGAALGMGVSWGVGIGSSVGNGNCVENGNIVEMVERGDWE